MKDSVYISNELNKNLMELFLTVAWVIALSPCVIMLTPVLKYHLGMVAEKPFIYSYSIGAVAAWVYFFCIFLNIVFIITTHVRQNKMNKEFSKSVNESDKEDFNQDIF